MDNTSLEHLKDSYYSLYGHLKSCEHDFNDLLNMIKLRKKERIPGLKKLDKRAHNWYMCEKMVGMMLYVDLFAGEFLDLIDKIPYLKELGITFVHLMPVLKPRVGENDGGYAVEDYLDVDPKLGTLDDFIYVLDVFRKSDIDVCIDFVLNHTANTHEWALNALKGNKDDQNRFIMYDTREIPDLYDQTIPDVLPDKCPGNFTWYNQIQKWVFTSFSAFQWDLNYKNPKVFNDVMDIMLKLANYGINIIRLDAIAFMWKEVGTSCRNLQPVHELIHMMHLIKDAVCPSVALLGEAIVQPEEIVKYFGTDEKVECGLLYNASLMVDIFNSFATRDTRLMGLNYIKFKIPSSGCYMNYIRCHDDIGWGLNETILHQLGINDFEHKRFLNDFYSGSFKGSFSKGTLYQYNPQTHDARINGTLASLLGLEKAYAINDRTGKEVAIKRILLAHALIIAQKGIPLIYAGDELGVLNDHDYLGDEHKKIDGRWMHRKKMDWTLHTKISEKDSDQYKIFSGIAELIRLRKIEPLFSGVYDTKVIFLENYHIYCMFKEHEKDRILCLFNFSENNQYSDETHFRNMGFKGLHQDIITTKIVDLDEELHLFPYEVLWLKKSI